MISVCSGLCVLSMVSTVPSESPFCTTAWQWLWKPTFYPLSTHSAFFPVYTIELVFVKHSVVLFSCDFLISPAVKKIRYPSYLKLK